MTNTIPFLSIASRIAIAAAIIYLAYQLGRGVDSLPEIERSLARVTQQVPPTLEAIEKTRAEIAEVRALAPQVLAETAAVRKQIPPILEEVTETRRQLPSLLKRIDKTVAVVDQTQRQIPRILDTTDRATVTIDKTRTQIENLTPQVLAEVRLTREKIDPTLERVDGLINDVYLKAQDTVNRAQDAGQEASEGAIGGIVTGILKLPFRLIGTLASPLLNSLEPDITRQLTQQDIELMGDAGKRATDSGKLAKPQYWQNADSGNAGSITLVRRFQLEESDCVETRITIDISGERTLDELESFCRNPDGNWMSEPIPSDESDDSDEY